MNERYVILGLAPPRAAWFGALSQWTTSAAIAAEFIKCVSAEELRARLASGRRHSAVLVDAGSSSLDRDLVDTATRSGCPVVVVSDRRVPADLGAVAVLPVGFGPGQLMEVLGAHCQPVGPGTALPPALEDFGPGTLWQAPLFTVNGPGGTGASTVAMALASGLAADPHYGGRVVLADLARRADQAMLHDSPELGPGLQELVEAHRLARPPAEEIVRTTFAVPRRGYHLLLGLRSPEAWSALRPRAIDAALDGLRGSFQAVVADVTGDFEGEEEGGSAEVEERNHLARTAALQATVNLVVGAPGLKGVHSLATSIRLMVRAGVAPERIVAVVNRSPRHPGTRAESSRALATLLDASGVVLALAGPVHLPERKIEDVLRHGGPLPKALVDPVTRAARLVSERLADSPPPDQGPARVVPGTLSTWADEPGIDA